MPQGTGRRYSSLLRTVRLKTQARFHPQIETGKKGLNGRKTENSPIAAEALTKAEMSGRYDDPRRSISGPSFSSMGEGTAQPVSETQESLKVEGRIAS
jgi:hypothetical protein